MTARLFKAQSPWSLRGVRAILYILPLCITFAAHAALQFDVFLGYDGIVPEASWFPVVCEVKNDGPTFTATIELTGGAYNEGQVVRTVVELPTGTLKRLVLPVFSSTRSYTTWDLQLLDERGRVRAEQKDVRPRKQIGRGTPILGAVSRTPGGTPVIRPVLPQAGELQPTAARLLPAIFPDNPIVLEGLNCLYLNSERAVDLTVNQVNAILAWLNAGGHLVIGVEQPSDVSSSPWLKNLFPCELKELKIVQQHPELQEWVRQAPWHTNFPFAPNSMRRYGNRYPGSPQSGGTALPAQEEIAEYFKRLPLDLEFEAAPMQVAVGPLRDGKVEATAGDTPLIVTGVRGRGRVTALLFSPEREPFRSWKNLDIFWAKLADVPGGWYVSKDFNTRGGWSSDGIFGAMIDTRQVQKLPIGWLLLLLVVYLVVIGPFDQYWLKRIGKPMLTWITFPCYVVLFSLLIYLIGYKLRAGESEWNDLHLVDVLRKGEEAELRGRTYSSVYSPSNQRYTLDSQQKYSTLRGEFAGLWGGGQSGNKASILQNGDNFKAEVFVPVWTSELYVSDWWQSADVPLQATLQPQADGWQVRVENRTEQKFTSVQLVIEQRIHSLGEVPAKASKTFTVVREKGMPLASFVMSSGSSFQNVVSSRQRALGASESGQIADMLNGTVAASFLSQLFHQEHENNFISPPGVDLSPLLERGHAVLLAWAPDCAPIKPMYHFSPRRSQRHTLWRLAIPNP